MDKLTLNQLMQDIQSDDAATRAAARDNAGQVGAEAVLPLGRIAATDDLEIARAANRAIQNVVYHAGRPGADAEAAAVSAQLLMLLESAQPVQLRRDVLWMLWQIAGEEAVAPVAALLNNAALAEDARMALERLPGDQATTALKKAFIDAAEADKPALAHSLRVRGVDMPGVPDLRLVPTKETSVKPVGR
jgi:hypothetical protein